MPEAKSWRERRWDLFLTVYNSTPEFRERLSHFKNIDYSSDKFTELFILFSEYEVPSVTVNAALLFIVNPQLDAKKYHELILVPISFWSKHAPTVQPYGGVLSLEKHMNLLLFHVMKKYGIANENQQEFVQDIIDSVALDTTVIQVQPYVGVTELRDLILEFSDDYKKLSSTRDNIRDLVNSPKLLEKVYKPTDQETNVRNELIRNWRNEDKPISYIEIAKRLESRGIEAPDESAMKQMVYNWKKRNRDKNK